jgi:hypothetical protein
MNSWGAAFLTLGLLMLVARLYVDFRLPQQTEQDQHLKKNLLTTSLVLFAVGLVLMLFSLFE